MIDSLCPDEEMRTDEITGTTFNRYTNPFECSNSTSSVTKEVKDLKFNGVRLIDAPGLNDNDPNFGDSKITTMITEKLKADFENGIGISSFCHCLMMSGGRLNLSSMVSFGKTLMSTTVLQEDFNSDYAPKFTVCFTALSKYEPKIEH